MVFHFLTSKNVSSLQRATIAKRTQTQSTDTLYAKTLSISATDSGTRAKTRRSKYARQNARNLLHACVSVWCRVQSTCKLRRVSWRRHRVKTLPPNDEMTMKFCKGARVVRTLPAWHAHYPHGQKSLKLTTKSLRSLLGGVASASMHAYAFCSNAGETPHRARDARLWRHTEAPAATPAVAHMW